MSAEKVQLVEVSENAAQRVTFKDGGKVKAKIGTKYLLKLDNSEVAPENVTVKRDGKDLLVFFQGSDKPDLVIQDFFADGMDTQLYGVSEDGQMYAYVRTDGEGFYSQLLLADGEMTPIALGGNPLGAAPVVNGEIDESAGFLLWPLLAGAGAVGGVAAATKSDDKHHTKTSPSVTDTQITDHVGPKQGVIANGEATDDPRPVISGKGEAGAIIHIYDNGQEIGSTTVGPDQTWTFTPNVDLNDGNHSIDVVQEGKGEKPSAPVHVIDFAVDTVPPSAPTAEISGAVEHDGQTYSPSNEPSIHGTGEPGDTIIVVYPTGETVTVDVKDDGTWVAPPPTQPLPEGNNDIKVIAQDPAGNQTEIVIPVIIDTIAPEAPKVWLDPDSDTGVKGDNITNDTRPTIDGHTEPGADVTVKFPTGETVVVTADANGDWSVTPTKPLPDGAGDITVVATDPAGNPSQPTVISLDIDTTAPDAPKVWLDPASDTGIKGDNITSDTKPTIDGKTEPNADVKVTLPTGEVINVKADGDGNWSVTPTKPLTEGDNSISVTATDAAGNASQPTVIVVNIDTTNPPEPVIGPDGTLDMVYDNVEPKVGPLNSGDSTNDTRPTFSGNGEPNQTITLYDGGKKIGEAVVGQDGKWSYEAPQDKPLSEGAHNITVTVTDVAGNVSPSSAPFVVVVDTIAPDAPQVWLDPDSDTGVKGDGITNETRPTIDGHTEPHADVTVTLPTGEVLTAKADDNGNWSVTPSQPLPEGNNNISVTAADAAGNTSQPTVIVVDIDTTPPDITKLLITGVEDHVAPITGNVPNGGETDDARPEISGKGTAGDTVIVFSKDSTGNHEIGRATVGADGTWKLTPAFPLVSGTNDLTAVEMDVAGNKTDPSAKYSIDVVIGTPSVPTIISVHDDVGPYQGFLQKGDVTDDSTPTFKGSADGGSVIKLYDGSALIGSTMADASGNWSITTDKLADGPHEVIATATNSVGQSSDPTGVWNFIVDTTAPDNVTGLSVTDNVGTVTGPLHAGDTTDDNRPVFSGGAEPNGKVIIYDNGKAIGEADVGADGKWSFIPTAALANGDHAFSTEVLDRAGNSSGQSVPLNVIVDTSKVLVSITHLIDDVGSITGDISNGGSTDDTRPTIQGTGKVGSIITVYDGSTKLGTAGVMADGSWTFKPTASLSEGAHTIKATATDLAGNVSDPATFVFIVDTTAPGKPTIDQVLDDVGAVQGPIANGGVSDDPNPTLSGKAEAGSRVAVYDNGAKLGEVIADKSGQWSYTPTTPITEGKHDFTVTATDAAGNTSANSDVFSITTDYSAPVKPSIDSVYDYVGEIQGVVARGGVTDDSKPVLSGEAEPGSKVIIYDNGSKLGETVADANGAWSYTPAIALSEGHHDFTITATDAAGNVSVKSDVYAVDTDYTPPDFTKLSITGVEDHVGLITGNIVNGGETDDARPEISGKGTAGDTVIVFSKDSTGNHEIGRATVDSDGTWKLTPSLPLVSGVNDLTAVEMDAAGNKTAPCEKYSVTLVTVGPSVPAIDNVYDDVGPYTGFLQKGDVTDDSQPTFKGSSDPGTIVKLYDGSTLIGSAVTDANGKWEITTSVLADGTHNVVATATNSVGLVSSPTGGWNFSVDTTAPANVTGLTVTDNVGAVTGPLHAGDTTDDNRPVFSGGAEPNGKVIIFDNGAKIGEADVGADGKWSFTPTASLPDGNHAFSTEVLDKAGNSSGQNSPLNVIVDTIGMPVLITHVVDDVGSITGDISNGGYTDDTRPEIQGVGKAGSIIKVFDGNVELGSTTVKADGTWSFTPVSDLGQGAHSITATATDKAGNVSDPTTAFTFTIDTVAPVKPTIDLVIDDVGAIQGPIANHGVTDDPTPTLSGQAEANSKVTIYDNGSVLGSVMADANGAWSYTPTTGISEGDHNFTVDATDKAGNTSTKSDVFSLTTDYTPPDYSKLAVTGVLDSVGEVTGNVANNGSTDDTRPVISGTGTAGDTIFVYDKDSTGNHQIGSAIVDASGHWSLTPTAPLISGVNELTAVERDVAGNTTAPSAKYSVTVVTVGPAVPTIESVFDDVGPYTGFLQKGDVTDDSQPTFKGTSDAGTTVKLYDGSTLIGSAVADANGSWSITTSALADGLHNVTATATDPIGQVSAPTGGWNFSVDTTAPANVTGLAVTDNVGAVTGPLHAGDTTDDNRPVFSGGAEPNGKVIIYDNGKAIGEADVGADGKWSFTPTASLPDGNHAFSTEVLDKAGNSSGQNAPLSVIVDTSKVLVSITHLIDDVGSITGDISNGGYTDDTRPEIQGTGKAGSIVTISDGTTVLGSVTVGASEKWSFTPAFDLGQGAHSITATATDKAGNVSDPTAPFTFIIDTVAPVKPTIDLVIDDVGAIQGPIANHGVTDDPTPTLSGQAEANSKVTIYDNGSVLGSVMADANGAWSYTPTTGISEGDHNFTVDATDKAGNTSVKSDVFSLTTDYTPPDYSKLAITGVLDSVGEVTGNVANNGSTDDTRPVISGTGTAGDTIFVYDKDSTGNHQVGSAIVDASGHWSLTPTAPLISGVNELTAVERDVAGNTTAPSAKYSVTVVTVGPAVPTIESVFDDVGPYTGFLQKGDVTDDSQPTFKGTSDAGTTVKLYDGSTLIGSAVADANGSWSITTSALADGLHNVTATATDPIGQVSAPTGGWNFSVDTTAPANVTGLTVTDNVGAVTGPLHAGDTTDDNRPVFSGGAEPNGKVIIFDNGAKIGEADVGADGKWSFTPTASLPDGNHAFSTEVLDKAGNSSGQNAPLSVIVDTSQVLVSITHLIDDVGSITGDISNGGYTDDTRPEIQGTGKAGSIVTISDGTTVLGSVTVGASEKWSFTPAFDLGQGAHSITATATDKAGNVSDPTAPFTFIIDTVAPVKPTIDLVIDDVGAIQGPIANHGVTDDPTPTLSGQAEANSKVTIYDNGSVLGSVMADANGAWSYTPTTGISEGDHNFTVDATDKAGNTSVKSDVFSLTTDYTPPDYSKLAITGVLDSVGEVTGNVANNGSTDDTRPVISGTGTAGDTIFVYDKDSTGNHQIGSAIVDASGHWSLTPTTGLNSGLNELTAVERDVAGNTTAPSATYSVTVMTVGPAVPTIESVFDDVGPYTGFLQKGDVTDDNQPTFKGTSDAGTTVKLYDGSTLIGSAVADANGSWSITTSALADGLHNVTATATDPIGQVSAPTGGWNFSVDTTAPANVTGLAVTDNVGAVTGPLHAGDTTDDNRPVFSGGAEPNGKVIIFDNGAKIGEADVGADGKWSFTPTAALPDGNHAFSTEVLDKAGNSSGQNSPLNVIVDTSQVLVSITHLIDDVGSITGDISNGGYTDDTRPEIQGTGKAGSTIKVSDGTVELGSTTVKADGTWSFTPVSDMGQGEHSITATATDKAGNVSDPTTPFTFIIDTVAPVKPSIDLVTDDVGAIQGPIANHGVTDDPTPTLSGQAEANSKVTIYDNGSVLGSVMADANGAWSYTPTTGISEGDHNFTVDATDKAGNTSVKSDVFSLTTDYTPPDYSKLAITGVLDSVGEVTGNVANNGSTDDTRPVISGTGTAGDTIFVYDKDSTGNHQIGSAIVDASGHWSLTPTTGLNSGLNELTAVERDVAGNTTAPSATYSVTVMTVGPAVPTIESVFDDVGPYTGFLQKGDVTDDNQPTFKGTSDAGTTVKLYDGSTLIGSAVADANGSWSITTSALADGLHNVTATATDPIGQVSAPTGGWNFSVDTTAPANVTGLAVTDNVGAVTGPLHAGDTTDDNRPVFSGGAEPNGKVIIFDNGAKIGEADVGADGKWSFTPTAALPDGNHAFSTEVLDKAGNSSGQNSPLNVIVDTSQVLVSITHLIDDVGSITGDISNGGYTDDTRPEIQGTGKAGSTIKVSDGTVELGSTTVKADGTWSFTPVSDMGQGEHSITATATDKAGNVSDPTTPFTFIIDTVAPVKPSIDLVTDDVGAIQGPIANHGVTDDPTPTLSGQAEANSKVTIYDNGSVLGSVMADANGAWSYTPTTGISEGDHNFTVDATDKAGNTSVKSDVFSLTTDYTPPDYTKLAITGVLDSVGDITGNIGNGGLTDDSRPVISGTGTAGDIITVYTKDSNDNHKIGSAIVDANGNWSMQPSAALVSGLNDLTAVESDPAGNSTAPSSKYSITLDSSVPSNLATITGITEDTGISDHDFITRDQTLVINGKVDTAVSAGEKVQFSSDGGVSWKDAVLSEDRLRWSYDNTSVTMAAGTYIFEARVVSQTGIAGQVTTQQVIIDISGPSNTTTIDLDPGSDWGDYNDDNITGDATPTINGKVTTGSDAFDKLTVTLFDDKNNDGKLDAGDTVFVSGVKVNSDGTWTVDLPSLKDGTYKLKAVVVDEAGNVQTPNAGKLIGAHGGTDDLVINSATRSTLVGEKPGDNAGWLITNVGDFNGDGIDDFFVTAPNANTTSSDLGKSYLIYGTGSGLPNLGNLGALKPSQGLIITNTDPRFTQEGMVASALADFNGDGYADIAVGSHYQDSMYVLFGGPNGTYTNGTLDLKSINDGDNSHGFLISTRNPVTGHGTDSWMFFGSAGGDIDGDGYTDLIFSNWGGYTNGSAGWKQGSVQVIYGGATLADGKPWQNIYMKYVGTDARYPDTFVPTTDLAKETITSDVRNTTFALAAGDKAAMGLYMGTVGDINGDGIEDMFFEGNDGTTSYLVYGKAGGFGTTMDLAKFRDGIDGVRFVTADNNMLVDRWYGYHPVARLGDINGDGVDDFAFGMPNAGIDRTVVIYGKKGGLDVTQPIGLANSATGAVPAGSRALTSADGFTILNDKSTTSKWVDANEWFGAGIVGGGDVNGDGIADFIIGAPKVTANGKSECGAIYVIYGREENFTNGVPAISITDLISDPSKGYVLYGQTAGEHLGQSVAMGDWNGDGIIDIAGSAPTSSIYGTYPDGSTDTTHGGSNSGAAYIYYSKADFTKMYTTGDDVIIADGKGIDGKPVDHNLILGGAGNDTILNIGKGDFANGGSGNDSIHVVSLDFRAVDGGTGTDTLVLDGSGLNLNLGAMQAKVMNFEKFDLGSGGNSMTVKLDDVLRMGQTDMMFKDGKKQMVIDGQTGSVDLTKTGIAWTESTASSDGHSYKVYTYGSAELLVEDKLQVHLVG